MSRRKRVVRGVRVIRRGDTTPRRGITLPRGFNGKRRLRLRRVGSVPKMTTITVPGSFLDNVQIMRRLAGGSAGKFRRRFRRHRRRFH